MDKLTIRPAAAKAIAIGGLCSIAYLAVYVAKNILGAVTPQITQTGAFTAEQIGTFSSVYYITYAAGQLINGALGDKIKTKYLISLGLILASMGFWLLPQLTDAPDGAVICYGSAGFFLAMIYAPMTKVVAENTEQKYAVRCSLGYTLASFLGSPLAGLLAAYLAWNWAFRVTGAVLAVMGVVVFFVFSLFERKGLVKYGQFKPKTTSPGGGIGLLISRGIIGFALAAVLTGVIRTTVVFWMPTYFADHMGYSPESAALIFSVASLVMSFSVFVAVFVFERLKRNIRLTLALFFVSSAVFFLLVFFIRTPAFNILFLVLAIIMAQCGSNVIWSCYCPSLYDTGMVSGATGFLDACSYAAASASSAVFAGIVDALGWKLMILLWAGLMVCGAVIFLPYKKKGI